MNSPRFYFLWLSILCLANEYETQLNLGRYGHSKITEQFPKEILSIARQCSIVERRLEHRTGHNEDSDSVSDGGLVSRLKLFQCE